jgi:hypothetical protein
MSRTLKIHHRQRLSKKRQLHFSRDLTTNPKELAKTINTPTPCSCWMCGNQRKHHGLTLQEQKMLIKFTEIDNYSPSRLCDNMA